MSLRNSIILSVLFHVLLFGTGFAFARYAGLVFPLNQEPIMVMLVGSGGASTTTKESEKIRQRAPEKHEKRTALPQERAIPKALEKTLSVPGEEFVRRHSVARTMPRAIAEPEPGRNSDPEQAAGSGSGTVSSEQWAIIVSAIEQAKSYPRLAREHGMEGVVRLRFRLKTEGDVEKVEIVKSSGHDILDRASVNTLYRAGPMPYVRGWIEVPIAYVLK